MLAGKTDQRMRIIGAACILLSSFALTLICWVLLRYQRNIVLICCLVFILVFFLFYRNSKSYKKEVKVYLGVIACYLIALLGFLNLFYSWDSREFVERHRFNLLSAQYRQSGELIEKQILAYSDTQYNEIDGIVSPLLTVHGSIAYKKEGNQVAVYFPTDVNFFISFGYLYLSSDNPPSFTYQKIASINDNWYYVKLY